MSTTASLPCVCCESKGPVATFDRDLDGMVCDDCRQKLRAATAWMKVARIIGCTHAGTPDSQTEAA